MRRTATATATATALLAASAAAGQAPLLSAELLAENLPLPVYITHAPGDRSRLFVVSLGETFGINQAPISIFNLETNQFNPEPFLRIPADTGGERGLFAMAFDPQYAKNGRFYVHVSQPPSPRGSSILRYTVSQDPDIADPASRVEVLFEPQTASTHQGGWLGFGPDGMLYIALGDTTVPNLSQQLSSVFGKLLRIDVRSLPYAVPPDNPFVNQPGARPEIWAFGLRNPWRASFDRHTGDLWIGDVGSTFFEEVNLQPPLTAGLNYGWPCFEGPPPPNPTCTTSGVTFPVHWFPTASPFSCYVTGGYVYRGERIPWMRGRYFYKACDNRIFSFRYQGGQVTDLREHTADLTPASGPITAIVSFGEDAAGELYIVSMGNIPGTGRIFRILPRCWANCDGSQATALSAADFTCFLNQFIAGDPYANCDGSTVDPVINVADFACFLQRYAAGCP